MSIDVNNLDSATIAKLRKKSKESLFFFARAILGFSDLDKDIHRPICTALQEYFVNNRLMIVLPRTWFKSTIGSIAYPIWRALNNPNIRILIAQNSMTNAKKKINSIKSIIETNALLQLLFPEILPKGDRPWSSDCLTINRTIAAPEGTFEPAGTGTSVTSRHFDLIIEDDTVAPDFDAMTGDIQQPTQMEIDKAIGWHKLCHPLLLHPIRSQILIIGTRWSPDDLIGWILKSGRGYKLISRSATEKDGLPCSAESGGLPIWDRFNADVLKELEMSLGPWMYSTLYLNSPTNAINQVFKRSYVHYYEKLPNNLVYCTSVDPAPSDGQSQNIDSDFNVVLTTGVEPSTGNIYIVHYNRDRVDPGQLIDILFDHNMAYSPLITKVESVAYQKTLSYWIRRRQEQLNKRFYIEEVKNARVSKSARIMGLQPWFAAGKIFIKVDHVDLERELLSFDPNRKSGTHDDVIDALSMQIDFWTNICETYRQEAMQDTVVDKFSGDAILDELLGRPQKLKSYPYDMGLMSERIIQKMPRTDYAYN